ncbi:hypothetical protein [uncultured Corynebacterium sp.]|uniref:hypothetical protein n=1 Tax=uncultured Corynebacterium sp. TaxID=159447 RepID=UPI0025EB9690|nr:hypothetical protein [uncultured Corynebacterium sp.]
MRRLPAILVAAALAVSTTAAPAVAATGKNTSSSSSASTSSTLEFNPIIVFGVGAAAVIAMNLLFNAINAQDYRTLFTELSSR